MMTVVVESWVDAFANPVSSGVTDGASAVLPVCTMLVVSMVLSWVEVVLIEF